MPLRAVELPSEETGPRGLGPRGRSGRFGLRDDLREKAGDDDDDDDEDEDDSEFEGDSESEEEEDEDDEGEDEKDASSPPSSAALPGEESCTFDLRNLTALNSHQVDSKSLYSKSASATSATIDVGASLPDEDQLLEKAREGCSQLLRRLWTLESERTDVGTMAKLPGNEELKVPRALPPPAPKVDTKWEKFAKERGIAPKEKRSRKVWDDATNTWMYRHGYQKANDTNGEWPIMEVGANDDPYADPWEKVRDEKRGKVEKNAVNRMRNLERAGELVKGTATRTMKGSKKAREEGRKGGMKGTMAAPPGGIPVDLKGDRQRGKHLTAAALLATQTSTASLGKFDKMREGEPERKKASKGLKKRTYESATAPSKSGNHKESDRNTKVLKNVLGGGGREKERAVRRGEYAKGETAYDYDYEDGLGSSSFKKRKGRAGAGKMKKMTKKRAK
mmetsp:Transcript_6834/g.20358  ORF Transcript_6834/g.20358 Transcript_6834/m.20358 type:complete len:448 (-) Transcript_6834:123-1466(-)